MTNNSFSNWKHGIIPKGLLVAIGGNEDKKHDQEIISTILSLVKKQKKKIEIITTASGFPEEVGRAYCTAFSKDSDHSVEFMHVSTREQANDVNLLQRIIAADVIFLPEETNCGLPVFWEGLPLKKKSFESINRIIALLLEQALGPVPCLKP